MDKIHIIGAGLAGSEAAYRALKAGVGAVLYEMKPERYSPAHQLPGFAELVCSNSLKSTSIENASGLLKEEMKLLGSLVIEAALATAVPAGGALAVDRNEFSEYITKKLTNLGAEIVTGEQLKIPEARPLIIATGPLTGDSLFSDIERLVGAENLFFYDAVSPIVDADSIDMGLAFVASRYGKGSSDYINCPLNKEEYFSFVKELVNAKKTEVRDFEDKLCFEGCLPVEVMAARGEKTLAFGPLKPVGLEDPCSGKRPYAVVQLRRENKEGTLYNMVGFQTRLTYGEQKRVFRMIPGLARAEFARFGKIHRNSYIDSPRALDPALRSRVDSGITLAGQITGVEGYLESAVTGIIAGLNAARGVKGLEPVVPPATTITGALMAYVTDPSRQKLEPMNANFGLLPTIKVRKKERKAMYASRAIEDMELWSKAQLLD